jgi:predicted GNAT family acetyltransferase
MIEPEITHDTARQRYCLIDDALEAFVAYEYPRTGVRNITHTIVPDRIGGRGYGQKLVRRAVEDALAAGDRLEASCWFARALIERRPDWATHQA